METEITETEMNRDGGGGGVIVDCFNGDCFKKGDWGYFRPLKSLCVCVRVQMRETMKKRFIFSFGFWE